jgi:hypothetical protein
MTLRHQARVGGIDPFQVAASRVIGITVREIRVVRGRGFRPVRPEVVHHVLNRLVFFLLIEEESVAINLLQSLHLLIAAALAVLFPTGNPLCTLLVVLYIDQPLLWMSLCFPILFNSKILFMNTNKLH